MFPVRRLAVLGSLLAFALAACGGGQPQVIVVTATPEPTQAVAAPTAPPAETAVPTPAVMTVSEIVDKLRTSTVLIDVQTSTDFGGTGSGFVYDNTGLIVTNAHVVTGAALIKVHFAGSERWYSARAVGIAPCDDLALIQVDKADVTAATIGSSDALKVGDEVVAIGYPKAAQLGTDLTVTRGVVSKLHASIGQYEDTIQTDAAINPGNSGGPLANQRGEVVGINTATMRGTQGINFAISIDAAKPVLEKLTQGKKLNYVGWNLVPNDSDLAKQYNLATDKGMIVAGVDSGSPASRAGIKPLDIIYDMQDVELTSDAQVCDILRSHSEGSALKVNVIRGTELHSGELNGTQLAFVQDLAEKATPTAKPQPTSPPPPPPAQPPAQPPQPQPTARPQPVGNKYGPATLTSPADGTGYVCFKPLVLSWSGPALQGNEWFVVESTKADHPNEWFGITDWQKETTIQLNPEKDPWGCSAPWWGGLGVYLWRVRIVVGDKSTHTIQADIAPPSSSWKINYGR